MRNVAWVAAIVLLLLAGNALRRWAPTTVRRPAAPPRVSVARSEEPLTLAAAGDAVVLRSLAGEEQDPAYGAVTKVTREATAALANLEMTLGGQDAATSSSSVWPRGTAEAARALGEAGIDLLARANNHATDHGTEGLAQTSRILDEAGLRYAGVGRNLQDARAPVFLQTSAGRIALVSAASSHLPSARAARARADIQGRPGVSPLRVNREVTLDATTFDSLKRGMAGLPGASARANGDLDLFGTRVRKGAVNRVEFVPDAIDVGEILEQVKAARRQANLVIVTVHAHEPGNASDAPPDFLREFARAAVDAGADVFVGHGPHRLRGVEIYRNRPIFFSLGNFFFHHEAMPAPAGEVYDASTTQILWGPEAGEPGTTRLFEMAEDVWWESVLAVSTFRAGGAVRVELYPLDLGVGLPRAARGTPRRAGAALAQRIIERLAGLSRPYDTVIRFKDGIGVIQLTPSSN